MGLVEDRICPHTPQCYAAAAGRQMTSHFLCVLPLGAPSVPGCSRRRGRSRMQEALVITCVQQAGARWEEGRPRRAGQGLVRKLHFQTRRAPSRRPLFTTGQHRARASLHPCNDPLSRIHYARRPARKRKARGQWTQSGGKRQSQAPIQIQGEPSTLFSAQLWLTRPVIPKTKAHRGPANWRQ